MSKLFFIVFFAVITMGIISPSLAAPGDLDSSFGSDGIVTTAIGTANNEAYSVVIDASGNIIVVGGACDGICAGDSTYFAVARYAGLDMDDAGSSDGNGDVGTDTDDDGTGDVCDASASTSTSSNGSSGCSLLITATLPQNFSALILLLPLVLMGAVKKAQRN